MINTFFYFFTSIERDEMYKRLYLGLILLVSVYACSYSAPTVRSDFGYFVDYERIINELYSYRSIHEIGRISEEERSAMEEESGKGSPVYGEINFESVLALIDELQLTSDDVFYDLGSGLGKLVFQMYLMTPVGKSIGIELSKTRFEKAQSIIGRKGTKIYKEAFNFENKMRKLLKLETQKKVARKMFKYYNGNFLKKDLSDATVIFTCSTCFPDECMQNLTKKLAGLRDGVRILSLRALYPNKNLRQVKTLHLAMSWSTNSPVYMYVVDRHGNNAGEMEEQEEEASESKTTCRPTARGCKDGSCVGGKCHIRTKEARREEA